MQIPATRVGPLYNLQPMFSDKRLPGLDTAGLNLYAQDHPYYEGERENIKERFRRVARRNENEKLGPLAC